MRDEILSPSNCHEENGTTTAVSRTTTSVSPAKVVGDVAEMLESVSDSDPATVEASTRSKAATEDSPAGSSGDGDTGLSTKAIASAAALGGVVLLAGAGYLFKDQIKTFLDFFIMAVDQWGPWGYAAYALVYTGLEVLAVPAIPLTMTAGIIFGVIPGTLIVSASATAAATIAFLIARYVARDKILELTKDNKKFKAIDRAIGEDGFKVVTLLRLSPLLPLAASNYLYGLTSVGWRSYVAGSWLGMLPGTWAYVSAGHVGKAMIAGGEGLPLELWQVGAGAAMTGLALFYVGNVAKKALAEVDDEIASED